jgi:tetratricopeptide (TPR) repeat protein
MGFVGLFITCVVAAGIIWEANNRTELAEQERQQAKQERQQAEQERQQAERERQQAERERQQAEESGRLSTNAEIAFNQGNLESAISQAKEAAQLDSDNPWKFFRLAQYQIKQGENYFSSQNIQSAIESYQNAKENLSRGMSLGIPEDNKQWVQDMEDEVNRKLQELQ